MRTVQVMERSVSGRSRGRRGSEASGVFGGLEGEELVWPDEEDQEGRSRVRGEVGSDAAKVQALPVQSQQMLGALET